ncbi:hypothetical protein ACH3VR_08120 [Microbacterium sp. B2969]|uniref:Uncharacterized protein n=1 Tax=Microbacterium alkaliflavum TaxID=3248839 RepID=A0ABW7Q628_9MICO
MTVLPPPTFASPGAQAEHFLTGLGRALGELGRVLGERVHALRSPRRPMSHEALLLHRENERMRDALRLERDSLAVAAGRLVH